MLAFSFTLLKLSGTPKLLKVIRGTKMSKLCNEHSKFCSWQCRLPPPNRGYNRDPNIEALKRRGFIIMGLL